MKKMVAGRSPIRLSPYSPQPKLGLAVRYGVTRISEGRPSTAMRSLNAPTAATAFALAFLLTGCQTAAVHDRIVEVVKPVAVQPIKPADVPVAPGSLGKRPPTLSQAADKALSGWCAAVAYMLKADALLRVSAGLPPQELGKYPECGVQ